MSRLVGILLSYVITVRISHPRQTASRMFSRYLKFAPKKGNNLRLVAMSTVYIWLLSEGHPALLFHNKRKLSISVTEWCKINYEYNCMVWEGNVGIFITTFLWEWKKRSPNVEQRDVFCLLLLGVIATLFFWDQMYPTLFKALWMHDANQKTWPIDRDDGYEEDLLVPEQPPSKKQRIHVFMYIYR